LILSYDVSLEAVGNNATDLSINVQRYVVFVKPEKIEHPSNVELTFWPLATGYWRFALSRANMGFSGWVWGR